MVSGRMAPAPAVQVNVSSYRERAHNATCCVHSPLSAPPKLTRTCPPGKLDWVLMRGCNVVSKRMGNHDYSASDHKWLQVDVRLQQQQK